MRSKKLKAFLASLLTAAAALSVMPCTVYAVQPDTSAEYLIAADAADNTWVIDTDTPAEDLPRMVNNCFEEAAASYSGGRIEPVLYYSSGIVSGVNYYMICREYREDGTAVLKKAVIYDPNHVNSQRTAKARFSSVEDLDIDDFQYNSFYSLPDTRTVGGATLNRFDTCDLTGEVKFAFYSATQQLEKVKYQPLAYLGKKMTDSGTYYAIMCCTTGTTDIASDRFVDVVTVFRSNKDECSIKYACTVMGMRYEFPMMFENKSYISNPNIYKGQTAKVVFSANGGSGNYTCSVSYRKMKTGKWITKKAPAGAEYMLLKPAAAATYEVEISVSDGKKELTNYALIWVSEPLKNTSTVSGTNIHKGESLKVNCSATGGSGAVKYAVYYKKNGSDKWTAAQKFSKNKTVSIKPMAATNYTVCVKTKDEKSTVSKRYYNVSVTAS